ncbi:MAG TPA: HAD hydrolase family protein [Pyrinomonadaceae bacterium]|jgi:3-deoxy-D-manno-octulosonate 8-phosphate phosphatase (KDO 8-P phosphatase)
MNSHEVKQRAARIKLLLMDCDGVLTDGRITLLTGGDEQKTFHVRDGHGLVLLHRAGLRSGIISGRRSSLVDRRAKELGIEFVRQGTWNKIEDFEEILGQAGTALEETAFVGDDVTDIPLMLRVGLAVAVADAVPETKQAAHLITKENGGNGAVREVTDLILQAQGRWQELMSRYFDIERKI